MRIGELGRAAGVSTRTLRHYESLGLLPDRRDTSGYRAYDDHDLRAVTEIRALVGLGFALEETRPFVECLRSGHDTGGSCPDSIAVYRSKIAEVDAYLARLSGVRAELETQLRAALIARAPDVAHAPELTHAPEPRCAFTPPEES